MCATAVAVASVPTTMEFNFTGSSRPERRINLGGTSGASAAQLTANARELRALRHAQKQRTTAATRIQAAFRAYVGARRVREALSLIHI